MDERIAVRLLGPIEVIGPNSVAILVGARQRSLVALLALQPGKTVTSERIIDGLWGEDVPRTALRTLQSHLARVRQAFAVAGLPHVVASSPAGHALRLAPEAIDAHVFDDRARRGRASLGAGSPREAQTLLSEGLALWRGDALQDGEMYGHAATEVDRLHDARSSAWEDLCDGRIQLGNHVDVLGDLQQLLAAYPYRERSASLLMLALYRAGRAADALDVYQRLRESLAGALGVDPSADLQQLYASILRQDPVLEAKPERVVITAMAGPAELPPRVGYFTGRDDEFASLDKVLTGDRKIILISGAAGMGKTALAVEWGHHAASLFPDGLLYLDLQGHGPDTTLRPETVLSHLLRGLGVPRDRMPTVLAEQTGLYRSLVHNRRFLILLDNASAVEQVLPAVPATESSLLMVTSRQELSALAVRQPVHFVQLSALDGTAGLDLLRRAVDVERIEGERTAATDLVAFCAGMPLALRITAARLASRPRLGLAELAEELKRRQLDALAMPGDDVGIRAVFASAYLGLRVATRRTFRLLALHPGPSFAASLAAAATDSTAGEVASHLTELVTASLLMPDGERFRFHDLIRLHAAECVETEEQSTVDFRIITWYLAIAHAANKVLDPARNKVTISAELAELPFGNTHKEVMAFLDGEQPSLGPVVRKAAAISQFSAAWQLTYLVAGFYDSRGSHDRIEMCEVGVDAAQRLGDGNAEALMRNLHAAACVLMRRYEDALTQLESALPLARESGDSWLQATAHTNIGVASAWLRRFDAARDAFEQALAIHTADDNLPDVALSLNNLGGMERLAGRGEEALAYLSRALRLMPALDLPRLEAIIRHSLGQAHQSLDQHDAALEEFQRALALRRQIGDRRGEAIALSDIGGIYLDLGRARDALVPFREALALSDLLGNRHLAAILHSRIGEALLLDRDTAGAALALERSLHLRRQIPDAEEEERLRRNLAELEQR